MPDSTLTGLPALLKRIQVLATSALSWLSALLAILIGLSQQLEGIAGVPESVTRLLASAIAFITIVVFQVRGRTPVADEDKGLLPPKGPAVPAGEAMVERRDQGYADVGFLLRLVALAAFAVVALMGAGWVFDDPTYIFAWLGLGLFAWLLSSIIPNRSNP